MSDGHEIPHRDDIMATATVHIKIDVLLAYQQHCRSSHGPSHAFGLEHPKNQGRLQNLSPNSKATSSLNEHPYL